MLFASALEQHPYVDVYAHIKTNDVQVITVVNLTADSKERGYC